MGQHWYTQEGKPNHKVPYADPKKGLRDATIRDAKKYSLSPSVTGGLGVLDKPGLNNWKEDQAILSAYTMPREKDESDKQFISRVKRESKEKAKLAAETGTEIHQAVENAFSGRAIDSKWFEIAFKVKNTIESKYGVGGWKTEESFCHPIGFGGAVDLNNRGFRILADMKTKEELKPKMAYDEHIMQLAAYREGLEFPTDTMLVNIFISWEGEVVFHEWEQDDADRGWEMFQLCHRLWCQQKRYDPNFEDHPF